MGKGMQVTPGQIMAVKGTKGNYSAILPQCNAASTQGNSQAPNYKHSNKKFAHICINLNTMFT